MTHAAKAVQAWEQRFNNPADSSNEAKKIATDAAGNVIVAGYTDDGITGQDMLTIKYSITGVPLWTNRYNGSGNGDDVATAVAMNGSGDVFVTGYSYGGASGRDYITLKYSAAGVPLWTNRYSGPGRQDDAPLAMAMDSSANVVITGYSYGNLGERDYLTIKYSSAGVPLWTNRYDGLGNYADVALAVAVDGSDNIFVTGYSASTNDLPYNYDYLTIKYSSAGVPLWTNRYDGPGNNDDHANALALDIDGNVYVTGTSSSTSATSECATIKYSSAGVPLWTNRYVGTGSQSGAEAVAVDISGNVFVTGFSFSSDTLASADYATIRYSNAGTPIWTNRYNRGPGETLDTPNAIAVDGSGNVFVTGDSFDSHGVVYAATVGYSSTGEPLWTNCYSGGAVAVTLNGGSNVFVTGGDFLTVEYSSVGVPLWTNRYNGVRNKDDVPQAVAVDSSGNVLVTGYSYGTNVFSASATIKYSSAGTPVWTNYFGTPSRALAVAVDSNDAVFVTGYSTGNGYDYATIGYSSAGVPLWTNRYNGPASYTDQATAITVDDSGNVFVTGASSSTNSLDYATIKYSNAGLPLWTNRYNGPGNNVDFPTAMVLDGNGNVFVTGFSRGSASDDDYATIGYSNLGTPLWTNRYNGPGNSVDRTTAIAVDGSGNVFVTGYSYSATASNSSDYATIKYSNAGVPLWTNRFKSAYLSEAHAIAVDSNGNIFVTGQASRNVELPFDYTTLKYSSAGVPLWTNYYGGAGKDNIAMAVAVDVNGNVFVTGYSIGVGSSNDFATIAYSNDGVGLWTNRYNGPANGDDRPLTKNSLALTPDGMVVIGQSDAASTSGSIYDYVVLKYVTVATVSSVPFRDGNQMVTRFSGMPGSTYTIEYEDSLTPANWQKLKNLTAPITNMGLGVGVFELREDILPINKRFYRAVYPPY